MQVGVIGINHKFADLKRREIFAKICLRQFSPGSERPHNPILLSTCNRTEIYFSDDDLGLAYHDILSILRTELPDCALNALYSFFREECFAHLCRVTAGLDSAIVGETEIQGQVKQAYEGASTLASPMHLLFQKALRTGKKVRTALHLGRGLADTESAIFEAGQSLFGDVHACRVLFVGASEINDKVLRRFRAKGLDDMTLCNRSVEKAEELACGQEVRIEPWHHLDRWHQYDIVVVGTRYPDYLITGVPPLSDPKLLVDLSVPRNVDPLIERHPMIALYNIERIHHEVEKSRKLKANVLEKAEQIIDGAVAVHCDRYLQSA